MSEVTEAFTTGKKLNQSGNNQQERASGRTICRCLLLRGYAPAATGSRSPAEIPLCAALTVWGKYLPSSATDWIANFRLGAKCTAPLRVWYMRLLTRVRRVFSPGEQQQLRYGSITSRSNRG